ncbi:MAG TPA: DUF2330 domain-containing protein [Methylomirabilota bacterium]|nr:DUF2330 domain-containing protein [Methylomirabilota bacterium]
MCRILTVLTAALCAAALTMPAAHAFCGFYVAKADAKLFNKASQVVIARKEDKTVLTMVNDYQGDPTEFAMVIPVPTFLERDQINVTDKWLVEHLDAYTAPRLVEYFDEDPCATRLLLERASRPAAAARDEKRELAAALGVQVEAQYTVGEYDIQLLSAKESSGLATYLQSNGYKLPAGAARVLESYIKQNMRFFVAKVNLKEQARLGFQFLRPLQVAYESPKFMLPIRLGTVNANGPQELFIYALSERGRVETVNYRTVKLQTDAELPVYVKNEFKEFYKAMFDQQVKKEDMRAVFLEYAWDMGWCDPCAADPLSNDQLRRLGAFWLPRVKTEQRAGVAQPQIVYITRLHVRYDGEKFPEDLVFQETSNRENFQGRYILRHSWKGEGSCPEVATYRTALAARQEKEAQTLAALTGWELESIRKKAGLQNASAAPKKWYHSIFKD